MKIFLSVLTFLFLTIITQVGGVIFLVSFITHKYIDASVSKKVYQRLLKLGSFLSIYLLATLFIVPLVARPLGRVALPLTGSDNLQPLNIFTCLLNR